MRDNIEQWSQERARGFGDAVREIWEKFIDEYASDHHDEVILRSQLAKEMVATAY